MRSLLGRTAAVTVAAATLLVGMTAAQGAQVGADTTTTDTSCTSTTTTVAPDGSTTTVDSSTTTTDPCQATTTVAPTTTMGQSGRLTEDAPTSTATSTSTSTTSTSTTTTTTTTSTSTTTTTQPPLLVAEIQNPASAVPSRGESVQVAETVPPPLTTTTTMPPPEWLLPTNRDTGTGRRVVYRKTYPMRVWLVEADGTVSKTHKVSGRADWNQPTPGTYSVFSRSSYTCNINNPHICWRYMVRFTRGPGGDNIGFHEIPTNTRTGYKLQSESQLGLALSGGCVRQATPDAIVMWNWAPIGTKVVVIP